MPAKCSHFRWICFNSLCIGQSTEASHITAMRLYIFSYIYKFSPHESGSNFYQSNCSHIDCLCMTRQCALSLDCVCGKSTFCYITHEQRKFVAVASPHFRISARLSKEEWNLSFQLIAFFYISLNSNGVNWMAVMIWINIARRHEHARTNGWCGNMLVLFASVWPGIDNCIDLIICLRIQRLWICFRKYK